MKTCPICENKVCEVGMSLHIINAAKAEAFANAMGDTLVPRHLIHLRASGWKRPKDRVKIRL